MSNIPISSICMIWLTTSLLLGYMVFATSNMDGFKMIGIPYLLFMSCLIHGIFIFWIMICCLNKMANETFQNKNKNRNKYYFTR